MRLLLLLVLLFNSFLLPLSGLSDQNSVHQDFAKTVQQNFAGFPVRGHLSLTNRPAVPGNKNG